MQNPGLILADLRKSIAFNKYANKDKEDITETELCFALQGTLDSSREVLEQNLETLSKYADEAKDDDVIEFLSWAASRFKNFLSCKSGQ